MAPHVAPDAPFGADVRRMCLHGLRGLRTHLSRASHPSGLVLGFVPILVRLLRLQDLAAIVPAVPALHMPFYPLCISTTSAFL